MRLGFFGVSFLASIPLVTRVMKIIYYTYIVCVVQISMCFKSKNNCTQIISIYLQINKIYFVFFNAGWNLLPNIDRHINEHFKSIYNGIVRMYRLHMDLWQVCKYTQSNSNWVWACQTKIIKLITFYKSIVCGLWIFDLTVH